MSEPPASYLDNLDAHQVAAVQESVEAPCVILAGPGGGKTRTLCARIIHIITQGVDPRNIVAITFSRKASQEMKERSTAELQRFSIPGSPIVRTFHSFALYLLRRHTQDLGFVRPFKILSGGQQVQVVRECVGAVLGEEHTSKPLVLRYLTLIRNVKSSPSMALGPDEQKVVDEYTTRLKYSEHIDMGDFISMACDLFRRKPEILELYAHKYYLVDEFQDANHIQLELCRVLTAKSGRLTVVGDVNQSIYGFQGATPENNFGALERSGAKVVWLRVNYRSAPNLVNAAHALIGHNTPVGASAAPPPATLPIEGPPIEVALRESTTTEITNLVLTVASLMQQGTKGCDIAVLCRTRALVTEVQAEMIKQNVPHYTATSRKRAQQVRS
eukprot:c15583_g1_i1.p1 GENE.c15583_g1_i1~~c15583_g1_i1.p1  ORF type:complete len:402 (+),score=88.77 c15583_g1_i1:51-1208(+)